MRSELRRVVLMCLLFESKWSIPSDPCMCFVDPNHATLCKGKGEMGSCRKTMNAGSSSFTTVVSMYFSLDFALIPVMKESE